MKQEFVILPSQEVRLITASVGFISPRDNLEKFVMVRNKRGWDIPGGHVETGETPLGTFERELEEETQCQLLPNAIPIAILESFINAQTGISVYRGLCLIKTFKPTKEIFERKFVTEDELVHSYYGNKQILRALLDLCQPRS